MGQGANLNGLSQPIYTTDVSGVPVDLSAPTPEYGDQRVFDGVGYTVSTAIIAVAANNYLSFELVNPAGSGLNFIMAARVFSSSVADGAAPLEYLRYAPTATLPGAPITVTVGNRISGGTIPPTGTLFRYVMTTATPAGGAATSGGFIPTGGDEKRIKDIVIIPPSSKLIYSIGGAGGGLAAAARAVSTLLFYTRPI